MTRSALRVHEVRTLSAFLGYQFRSRFYSSKSLIRLFENATQIAEAELRKNYPQLRLKPVHEALELGKPLGQQIVALVCQSSAAVFEISANNSNVYFELGLSYGKGVRSPILLFNTARKPHLSIGSDVRDLLRIQYSSGNLTRKQPVLARAILNSIRQKLREEVRSDPWTVIRRAWMGRRPPRKILLVCPELPRSYCPKFANPKSPEFVNLARYGDADALVDVLALLPRLAPHAEIDRRTSREMASEDLRRDLIVIGGPDFNELGGDIMRMAKVPFAYRTSRGRSWFEVLATNEPFRLGSDDRGRVNQDYGLFARVCNPWNPEASVVLLGGLQTFGVLGAVKALSLTQEGKARAEQLKELSSGKSNVAMLIPISVARATATPSPYSSRLHRIECW